MSEAVARVSFAKAEPPKDISTRSGLNAGRSTICACNDPPKSG
jgi:hypothetical protein